MVVTWIVAVTLLAFSALLVGGMVVLLRAADKRAVARDRAILAELEQIRGSIEQIEAVARLVQLVDADRILRRRVVHHGFQVVHRLKTPPPLRTVRAS
jgi:hypothetical protein